MAKVYLAVDDGYNRWQLTPYNSNFEALQAAKSGETYGCEWKILKELDITFAETEEKEE